MKPTVLVVDDEKNIRRTLAMILRADGYAVAEAASGEDALERVAGDPVDLVLLDVNLPGIDGIDALGRIHRDRPELPVLMISGQATVSTAVAATRAGALDFLEKPLSKDRVLIAIRNALRLRTLDARVTRYETEAARRRTLIGDSAALEAVRSQVAKVAPTAATVLITGESGTGKELAARAVHDSSPRRDAPFVKVNCAAIPEELIESELFGAVRGAYTGADRDRDGKFQQADGGTLFLDEIGDMSVKVQAKVLRALQEGEVQRVGDNAVRTVDVRVVAATNKDLADEVAGGRFREDLFYRLNVVPITMPPLRDRAEDIPGLCRHFLDLYADENGLPPVSLTPAAVRLISEQSWRGNIRELRNVLERLAILGEGPELDADQVEALVGGSPAAVPAGELAGTSPEDVEAAGGLVEARRRFEKRCIERSLDRTGGNVSRAARRLGIERSNLHKKMQALGLEARPPRPGTGADKETT